MPEININYNRIKPTLIINGEEIENYESVHLVDPETQTAKWFINYNANKLKEQIKRKRINGNRMMQQRVFDRMCEFVIDTHNRISPSDAELTAMAEAAKAVLNFKP